MPRTPRLSIMKTERKFLIINPKNNYVPLNCAYVLSTLRQHQIPYEFIDMQFVNDLRAAIREKDYFAVGLGGLILHNNTMEDVACVIKSVFPNLPVIFGGRMTVAPEELLRTLSCDFLVIGDASLSLPQLCNALINNEKTYDEIPNIAYRRKGKLVFTERLEHKSLDDHYPCWDEVGLQRYMQLGMTSSYGVQNSYPLVVGMGCVGRCFFCAPSYAQLRLRSVDSVMAEIESAAEKYNYDSISLISDVFYTNVEQARDFCDKYLASGIGKPLIALMRADADPNILRLLVKAGLKLIIVGVEAYHSTALKMMNKGITLDDIDRTFAAIKQSGVKQISGFMIGNPGDTCESLDQTVDFFIKNKLRSGGFSPTGLLCYPGTINYKIAVKKGLIECESDFWRRLSDSSHSTWLTLQGGLGAGFPNITRMSNHELEEAFYRVSFRMYRFQTEQFSPSRINYKTNTAICGNCSSEITINRVPVECYLCRNCFSLNFVNLNEAFLDEERILDIFHKYQRVAIAGTFQFIYALTRLMMKSSFSQSGLQIVCTETMRNRFSAYIPKATFLSIENKTRCDADAVMLAGLHTPREMTSRFAEAGVDDNKIFNITPPGFKKHHRNQLLNPYYYFEHTFAADLTAFGEIIGGYLKKTIGEAARILLPATSQYAENINIGIKKFFPTARIVGETGWPSGCDFTHAVLTGNRLDNTQFLRKEIANRYHFEVENILSLKEHIYKEVWGEIFC